MTVSPRTSAAGAAATSEPARPASRQVDDRVVNRIGQRLRRGEQRAKAIASPMRGLAVGVSDAYAIQDAFVRALVADGSRVRGYKVGAGPDPAYGVILEDRILPNGSAIEISTLIRPAVEVEIGFLLREPLRGPGVTAAAALAATSVVVACFEIVDSRIAGRAARWVEVVADNGRAARVVLGDVRVPPTAQDLRVTGVVLERNGQVIATGAGAAVFGHPAMSVAWLANELGNSGAGLGPGVLILSGAITPAVPARPGDEFCASVAGLGDVTCRFV